MSSALLETRGLSLSVPGREGERTLLRGLDWRVQPGERWCVLGRNAVGKSTLLRAAAGLSVSAMQGEVLWNDRLTARWSAEEAAGLRAYQPQTASDRFGMSVHRLLDLAVCSPVAPDIAAALRDVDALDLIDRDVRQLSGGERQRVALAQCAVQGAPLMLLDEPISFQDPAHQQQIGRWLVDWCGASRAVVMTAHDVNWVARVATHVLLLGAESGPDDAPDVPGTWRAGPVSELLTESNLRAAYRCGWRNAGGMWMPAD